MLRETQNQLKALKTKMNISFILNQQNVYDAFIKCLNDMESIDLSVSHRTSTTKNNQSVIPYDRKSKIYIFIDNFYFIRFNLVVKITLISSNDNHLIKCKEDILNLARSCSTKVEITKQDMLDWSQKTIYTYYGYCLKQRVIPRLDLPNTRLELVGPKDAVRFFYLINLIINSII